MFKIWNHKCLSLFLIWMLLYMFNLAYAHFLVQLHYAHSYFSSTALDLKSKNLYVSHVFLIFYDYFLSLSYLYQKCLCIFVYSFDSDGVILRNFVVTLKSTSLYQAYKTINQLLATGTIVNSLLLIWFRESNHCFLLPKVECFYYV